GVTVLEAFDRRPHQRRSGRSADARPERERQAAADHVTLGHARSLRGMSTAYSVNEPGRCEMDAHEGGGVDEGRLRRVILAAAVTQAAINIDFFAMGVALPRMAHDLGTTATALQWVVSGYLVALGA